MENTKWLEQAIKEGHINFHAYEKFSDVVVIGRGAFGEVYKAAWDNRGMIVALKSLLSNLEENVNPQLLNELIKEHLGEMSSAISDVKGDIAYIEPQLLEDLNDIHLDGSKPKVISSNNIKGTENNSRSNISKSINRRSVSSFTEISSDLSNAINDIDETYHSCHSNGITGSCSADLGLSSEMMNAVNQMDKVYYNNRSDNASEVTSIKSLKINSSASSNSQNVSSSLKSPRLPKSRRSSLNSPPSSPTSLTHGRIQNTDKAFLEELLKFFEELLELSPDTTTMISKLKGYLHNRMREHKSTFKLLLKYHNDVRFACLIGYCLECAIGTAQDKHEGFKYYQKSADSNNSNGQYFLASAEAGNVTSQMELGRCYEEGIGTKKNIQLASECYEKSYKGGFTLAKKRWDHILKIQRRLQLSKNSPNITQALRHRGDLEKSRANTMELPDRVPNQSFSTLRMFKVACFMVKANIIVVLKILNFNGNISTIDYDKYHKSQ
ncbi:6375_t:CDS:2 [Funneliformis mosseae]|uniref:6375_t:CDS:1 n=1 Tax=Funneliformis mosseae TaxID=27381 RepID=A0A9N8WF11_FUNMO|nr:6375_t:CDS:2 [Funneliformis mosseae]